MKADSLRTRIIGKRIILLDEISSTNDEARRLVSIGEKESTVVIAASQTKGRGRLSRRWISPPGGLYISVILKPYVSPSKLPLITMIASVAAVRTIRGITKLYAEVKWPNDIVINDKKVGGVLCEASKNNIIVGIGLNLNNNLSLLPSLLKKQATSLKFEMENEIDRDRFIKILLEELDKLYSSFLHRKHQDILSEWTGLCSTLGKHVKIETGRGESKGIAEKIGVRGELLLRRGDGKIARIDPGSVIKVNMEE